MLLKNAYHKLKHIINTFIAKNEAKTKVRRDKRVYIEQCGNKSLFSYSSKNDFLQLYDYNQEAGTVDSHYFFQDIFVANDIFHRHINQVYDIGSRLDGFIAHLLSMDIKTTMIDIRPLSVNIDNLFFIQGNATDLSNIDDNSLECVTSLHAIEHFGLGRYGDPIDYDAWNKALLAMSCKVKEGGYLYVSVPVSSKDVLKFNAHRIFNPITIYKSLSQLFSLQSFSVVNNKVVTYSFEGENTPMKKLERLSMSLGDYDCGIFCFCKTNE
ncbi:MAG: DUF268 domain-containing protein [Spirochaetales bacterium]|nr:DUF268 domain-containing protein [Spirochaetales bacterium]